MAFLVYGQHEGGWGDVIMVVREGIGVWPRPDTLLHTVLRFLSRCSLRCSFQLPEVRETKQIGWYPPPE